MSLETGLEELRPTSCLEDQTGTNPNVEDDIEIPNLPVCLAVIEVLEYLILLYHMDSSDKVKTKRTSEEMIQVKMHTVGLDTASDQVWWQVKVIFKTTSVLQFQARDFLRSHATCLRAVNKEMEKVFKDGHLWTDTTDPQCPTQIVSSQWRLTDMSTSLTIGPSSTPTTKVVFRVIQDKVHMMTESQAVHSYLHRLRLTHASLDVSLSLNVGGAKSYVTYRSVDESRCVLGHRLIASSSRHYASVAEDDEKLQLRSSSPFLLSGVRLERKQESLKLTAAAALVPCPPHGSVVISTDCRTLQVLIYGPGNLPLIIPGVEQASFSLLSVLQLEDYGLQLGRQLPPTTSDDAGVAKMDWRYELEPAGGLPAGEDPIYSYTLQLILFLDRVKQPEGLACALHNLCAVDRLRQTFSLVLLKHRGKVRRAVCGALSKVLHNTTSQRQKQELLESVVPKITSSMSAIITRSTSDTFRARCFTAMQVTDSRELHHMVEQKLWSVAEEKFGVVIPQLDRCDPSLSNPGKVNKGKKREAGASVTKKRSKTGGKEAKERDVQEFSQHPKPQTVPVTNLPHTTCADETRYHGHIPITDFTSQETVPQLQHTSTDHDQSTVSNEFLSQLLGPLDVHQSESFDLLGLDLPVGKDFVGLDASNLIDDIDLALDGLSPSQSQQGQHSKETDVQFDEDWFNDILYSNS